MFDTSAGLLLNNNLHETFITLSWSLYLKVSLIRHIYYILKEVLKRLTQFATLGWDLLRPLLLPQRLCRFPVTRQSNHPRTLFSFLRTPPDPRLVAWHYNQAVKARIRGFSVGMVKKKTGGL